VLHYFRVLVAHVHHSEMVAVFTNLSVSGRHLLLCVGGRYLPGSVGAFISASVTGVLCWCQGQLLCDCHTDSDGFAGNLIVQCIIMPSRFGSDS